MKRPGKLGDSLCLAVVQLDEFGLQLGQLDLGLQHALQTGPGSVGLVSFLGDPDDVFESRLKASGFDRCALNEVEVEVRPFHALDDAQLDRHNPGVGGHGLVIGHLAT